MAPKSRKAGVITYRCGVDRLPAETVRVGAVRYMPRGVKKIEDVRYFDAWLPVVAPGAGLIKAYKEGLVTWSAFKKKYVSEMKKSAEARRTIRLLMAVAVRVPVAIGCYCEDVQLCHRSVLKELIEGSIKI